MLSEDKMPRAATEEDLLTLLESLARHQVDYVLIGGCALNIHGYMRFTSDIDLLLPMNELNGKRVMDALMFLPEKAASELSPEWLAESGTVRVFDEITVDLMTVAANGETYESLREHIKKMETEKYSYYVLDLEGLLKTKNSVRPKDMQDAAIIRSMLSRETTHSAESTKKERPTVSGFFRHILGTIKASNLERDFHNAMIPRLNDPALRETPAYEQACAGAFTATVRALVKDANMNAFALVEAGAERFAVPVSDTDRDRLVIGESATFQTMDSAKYCALVVPSAVTKPDDALQRPDAENTGGAKPDF